MVVSFGFPFKPPKKGYPPKGFPYQLAEALAFIQVPDPCFVGREGMSWRHSSSPKSGCTSVWFSVRFARSQQPLLLGELLGTRSRSCKILHLCLRLGMTKLNQMNPRFRLDFPTTCSQNRDFDPWPMVVPGKATRGRACGASAERRWLSTPKPPLPTLGRRGMGTSVDVSFKTAKVRAFLRVGSRGVL